MSCSHVHIAAPCIDWGRGATRGEEMFPLMLATGMSLGSSGLGDAQHHGRLVRGLRRALALLVLLAGATSATAQTLAKGTSLRGFQMVQHVDDVLYGVDALGLEIRENRYVRDTYVKVSVSQPSPILGVARFVADCQEPLRLALVSSSALTGKQNEDGSPQYKHVEAPQVALADLEFFKGHVLDGTRLVAEFACRSSVQPGRAREIARELYERGGPSDMQIILCDMRPERGSEVQRSVPVRFSASEQVVAVNHQWFTASEVTPEAIIFGSGAAEWRVDRAKRTVQLLGSRYEVLYTGACAP